MQPCAVAGAVVCSLLCYTAPQSVWFDKERPSASGMIMRVFFWRSLVIFFLILAFIGVLVPGIPFTVFLILAAWAASKGWPAIDHWLVNHPKYGHLIRDWRANGTIPRKAKVIASVMMLCSGILMLFTNAPLLVKIFTDVVMALVCIWMWSRPEPVSDQHVQP